jgi:hypothetical protein
MASSDTQPQQLLDTIIAFITADTWDASQVSKLIPEIRRR